MLWFSESDCRFIRRAINCYDDSLTFKKHHCLIFYGWIQLLKSSLFITFMTTFKIPSTHDIIANEMLIFCQYMKRYSYNKLIMTWIGKYHREDIKTCCFVQKFCVLPRIFKIVLHKSDLCCCSRQKLYYGTCKRIEPVFINDVSLYPMLQAVSFVLLLMYILSFLIWGHV